MLQQLTSASGVEYHPRMSTDQFFHGGKPGESVPTVEMADLKAAWAIYNEIESRHPGRKVAVGSSVVEKVCSPGADISAVIYRIWMLGFLEMLPGNLLSRWKEKERLDDAVFTVIARVPMKWMEIGVVRSDLPFDVQSFLEELRQESR